MGCDPNERNAFFNLIKNELQIGFLHLFFFILILLKLDWDSRVPFLIPSTQFFSVGTFCYNGFLGGPIHLEVLDVGICMRSEVGIIFLGLIWVDLLYLNLNLGLSYSV